MNETVSDPTELEQLEFSGLFDAAWYQVENPDVRAADLDALLHFCRDGWREGRKPNPYFDPTWYLDQHPDVRTAGRLWFLALPLAGLLVLVPMTSYVLAMPKYTAFAGGCVVGCCSPD